MRNFIDQAFSIAITMTIITFIVGLGMGMLRSYETDFSNCEPRQVKTIAEIPIAPILYGAKLGCTVMHELMKERFNEK